MTSASGNNNGTLYIIYSTWNSIQRKFKKGIRSKILQPDTKYNEWKLLIGRYIIISKNSENSTNYI